MGWDINPANQSKKDVANDMRRSMERSNWKIHAEKSAKDGIWYVVERPSGEKMIYFAMVERRGYRGYAEYAVKTMPETMGPASNTCPLSFFEMVECPDSEYAKEWRESVKASQQRANRKPSVGQKILLYKKEYEVTGYGPRNAVYAKNKNGDVFKLSKRNIEDYQEVQ